MADNPSLPVPYGRGAATLPPQPPAPLSPRDTAVARAGMSAVPKDALAPKQSLVPRVGLSGPQALQLQETLIRSGYKVARDGRVGPQTLSAYHAWMNGVPSTKWNGAVARSAAAKVAAGRAALAAKGGQGKPGPGGPSSLSIYSSTSGSKSGGYSASDFGAGTNPAGTPLDEALANQGADLIPTSYAGQAAGLQFDPQIYDTNVQLKRQPLQSAQDLADIKAWYAQVLSSLGTARGRNAAAAAAATGGAGSAGAAILASLGGNANGGAGMVGSAGEQAAGTLAALGQAEDQYQNDLAPLLQDERAGALRNQTNIETKQGQDLANQLASLQGQRGAAKAALLMQIMGQNNGTKDSRLKNLLDIKQYNNTLGQQNFSDNLSAKEAAISAAMSNAQINGLNVQSGVAGASAFKPWGSLAAPDRYQLLQAAANQTGIFDTTGALTTDPVRAAKLVRQWLMANGYSNAANSATPVGASINTLIASLIAGGQNRKAANAAKQAAVNG